MSLVRLREAAVAAGPTPCEQRQRNLNPDLYTLLSTLLGLFSRTENNMQSSDVFLASLYSCLGMVSRVDELVVQYHAYHLYASIPAGRFRGQCFEPQKVFPHHYRHGFVGHP